MLPEAGLPIPVDLSDFQCVHLAVDGTPIVDGYQNLNFQPPSGIGAVPKTMFIQHKHSGLASRSITVNVSSNMNREVANLRARLTKRRWSDADGGFIFLWVTNRQVERDVTPDDRLLWVENSTLAEHAPLLGTRGLLPEEELRQD